MNQLVSIPQLSQTMMAMAREMERAGLIEEVFLLAAIMHLSSPVFYFIISYRIVCYLMFCSSFLQVMSDSFAMMDEEGADAAADAEVDRILQEITASQLKAAPDAPVTKPAAMAAEVSTEEQPSQEETDAELSEIQRRLAAL